MVMWDEERDTDLFVAEQWQLALLGDAMARHLLVHSGLLLGRLGHVGFVQKDHLTNGTRQEKGLVEQQVQALLPCPQVQIRSIPLTLASVPLAASCIRRRSGVPPGSRAGS